MPSLIDLRRRIRAVKNTQQITKAMKMVAASKLRPPQAPMTNPRPHAHQLPTLLPSMPSGQVDRVGRIYHELRWVMAERGVVDHLPAIVRAGVDGSASPGPQVDYLYEPSPEEIFNQLLPRYVEVQVYRALLESNASFFAAQMTAMDTATKNSAEMIGSLTLYMNKVRQAAITREIIEVVSGAQAL